MSKHTPGPWQANVTRECISDAGDCYSHWNIRSDNSTVCCIYHGDHNETNEANARLIAAAPDLYETLCRMSYIFMQVVQAVEIDIEGTRFEVVNKATGEKGSLSLQEVFEAASSAMSKVHGETNE